MRQIHVITVNRRKDTVKMKIVQHLDEKRGYKKTMK